MGIVSGRLASVRMGSSGIDYIGKWTINVSNDTVEAVPFGSFWALSMPVGMKWSGSVEGWFDASTTGGVQSTMWTAILSAVKVQDLRFYVGGSTSGMFYMPQYTTCGVTTAGNLDAGAYLGNFKHTIGAKELGTISFDVMGYKGIGLFSATSVLIAESTG
jgi:hypothetical protein